MWIVVLVTGSMPPALYDAYAALLRYQARFHSWFSMLTSEYAWGMLGDFVPLPPAATMAPPLAASPAPHLRRSLRHRPGTQPPARSRQHAACPAHRLRHRPRATVGLPDHVGRAGGHAGARGRPARPAASRMAATAARPTDRGPPAPCRRPRVGAHVDRRPRPDPLPPWGILVLRGQPASWMIFAIVWGSIVFVGQNVARGIGQQQQRQQPHDVRSAQLGARRTLPGLTPRRPSAHRLLRSA